MGDFRERIVVEMPPLKRYAVFLTKSHHQAEDLLQDTLLRALSKRHLFVTGTDLRAWLFTIMHNLYATASRRRLPHHAPLTSEEIDNRSAVKAPQLERLVMRDLVRGLALLPDAQRQAVLLAGADGMSYEDIAVIADVPIGTVRSRLSRGRDTLQQLVSGSAPQRKRRPRIVEDRPAD